MILVIKMKHQNLIVTILFAIISNFCQTTCGCSTSRTSIRPEPSFVGSTLKNITVAEGHDVVLSCTVKNLDGHEVAWIHYDRSAILTVGKTVITRKQHIGVSHEGNHTWNLHIHNVQRSDAGAYMCQINTSKAKTRMGHLTVVVLPEDKFSLSGKITRTKEEYQNPNSLSLLWIEIPNGRALKPCGRESILYSKGFTLIDNITFQQFDKRLHTFGQTGAAERFSEILNVSEEQIRNHKLAYGFVGGNYGNEDRCNFFYDCLDRGAQKGPNGEWAFAVEYAIFYRNGTFPSTNCEHFDYPGDEGLTESQQVEYYDYKSSWGDKGYDCHEWGDLTERKKMREKKCNCKKLTEGWMSKIPEGFSCGKLRYVGRGVDDFMPVDCSEVELQVSNPRPCKRNPEPGDDCMKYPNWPKN